MKSRVTIVVVTTMVVGLLGGCRSSGSGAQKPPHTPAPHSFGGTRTVGALFRLGGTEHTCTASVVTSSAGDLLVTAAHCVSGTVQGYRFAPGYHGGTEPFGSWVVLKAYGAPEWIAHQVPQSDFAFLVVAPRKINGHLREIQNVTGGNRLGSAPTSGDRVTVPGYPNGSKDPITCTAPVYYEGVYPAFNCDFYPDGTSGGPWLVQGSHGSVVVGVIGGLHQGGCSWAVYSGAFGPASLRAYSAAAKGAKPSTFPQAGSSGC